MPESQDEAAKGSGDLSVHQVTMDPEHQGVAYLASYAAGLQVVEYSKAGITEVPSSIDEGGNNLWRVRVWHDEKRR